MHFPDGKVNNGTESLALTNLHFYIKADTRHNAKRGVSINGVLKLSVQTELS